MDHLIARPEQRRPAWLFAVLVLLLAAGAVHAPAAAAENVPNPEPALIARWEPCEPNAGVTVIVDRRKIGDGMIDVGCALGEQATGVEALQHAGFVLEGTTDFGLAFICRIDGEPTPQEQACETTPGSSAYWSYWRGKPQGRWDYSAVGAKSPQSRSAVNSVEGWSFGASGAPRIEPMDGGGPSSFHLPPQQESSAIPAEHAREWLTPVLDETAIQAEGQEAKAEAEGKEVPEGPAAQELLPAAIALARAGSEPVALSGIVDWLARSCKEHHNTVEGCPLRELANPNAPREQQSAARFALAVLGLHALGQNPDSFAGLDLRGELEGMVKSTGVVVSEGQPTEAVETTAPTVLALAQTGALSEGALKSVGLILAKQDAAGGFEEEVTPVDVEAIEALVAAREQGVGVLGQGRLDEIQAALGAAGDYLEAIEEPGGGIGDEKGAEPDVESTALGAVGLALAGEKAAAERAAKWVSRYQVTAEAGEHTPAEHLIGAFLSEEAALRNALAYGVESSSRHGLYSEARSPTADALLALVTAGPYYDAAFAEQSLLFETRTVGSQSRPLAATLTDRDVRPITIAAISVAGAQAGDFHVDGSGCIGRTLPPGGSCEVSASFAPTTTGLREALLEVGLASTTQTIELPIAGTGLPKAGPPENAGPEGSSQGTNTGTISSTGSQGVLGIQTARPVRVQTPRLTGQGTGRGLVGVSWRVLGPGVGLSSWAIASKTLGAKEATYVTRATGAASATSALLKLPAGATYELRITITDALGGVSATQIGKVRVPYDDRWNGLHYNGHWLRVEQPGAWLDTVSRASTGAQVSLTLGAGRPVFMARATARAAIVEVRAGSRPQLFSIAGDASGALREIVTAERARAGAVSLRVLKGAIDLDGVAVEG
jgi:hypothetical protein